MPDYQYLVDTGVILPDTAAILEQTRDEFRTAFGQDLDVSAESPQGVLITAETLARDGVVRNNAALANQINPNIAGGVFLDAIWMLLGGQRVKATPSIVRDVVLTGVPSVIIPAGSIASVGPGGAQFQLLSGVPLNASGTGIGVFQSLELGPVPAGVGDLNQIVTSVLGWETVANPNPAELGRAEETDLAARLRRRRTLAFQGVALPEAILSGVYSVEGVRSAVFRENVTAAPITIEGVTLGPHSIYVDVDGGTDLDIATVLLRKKSLGAGWNGATTVGVIDDTTGQTYDVKFSRPAAVPIYVRVTVRSGGDYPNVPQVVRDAMVAYSLGEQDGEVGFAVGEDVSPFELAGAVNRSAPSIYVQAVTTSTDGITYSTNAITITIAQIATLLAGNIAVTVV